MTLWIRTQDKQKILMCETVNYHKKTKNEYYMTNGSIYLGKYDSEERCIEILDEIYNQMTRMEPGQTTLVYQMPEEQKEGNMNKKYITDPIHFKTIIYKTTANKDGVDFKQGDEVECKYLYTQAMYEIEPAPPTPTVSIEYGKSEDISADDYGTSKNMKHCDVNLDNMTEIETITLDIDVGKELQYSQLMKNGTPKEMIDKMREMK